MLRRDERDRGRGRIYAGLTIVARWSAVGYHGARLILEHPFAVIRASAADACRDGPKVRHVIDGRLDWISNVIRLPASQLGSTDDGAAGRADPRDEARPFPPHARLCLGTSALRRSSRIGSRRRRDLGPPSCRFGDLGEATEVLRASVELACSTV